MKNNLHRYINPILLILGFLYLLYELRFTGFLYFVFYAVLAILGLAILIAAIYFLMLFFEFIKSKLQNWNGMPKKK